MAKGGFRGGFPGGGNQMQMMKQAQKMQQEFMKMQQELESSKFEGTAGGGAVKAVVSGTHQFESVTIDPEVVDPEDVEMLEDFITIAYGEALRKANDTMETRMNAVTGGMNIPGLF
jgi:DNA-binding YbaB/EbfC family protein